MSTSTDPATFSWTDLTGISRLDYALMLMEGDSPEMTVGPITFSALLSFVSGTQGLAEDTYNFEGEPVAVQVETLPVEDTDSSVTPVRSVEPQPEPEPEPQPEPEPEPQPEP
jgi:hypothetical protein